MAEIIKLYKKARFIRNIAIAVMLLSWAVMIALIVVGVLVFLEQMTLFMIAALLIGGAGTAAYFVLNLRLYARENDVCAEILRTKIPVNEAKELVRELKLDMNILRLYVDGV